jgi:hypothetical protein
MQNNMFFYKNSGRAGFLQAIVIIVIFLVVLGLFGLNIQKVFESKVVKENISYAWDLTKKVWNTVLAKPAKFIWDKLIIGLGAKGINQIFEFLPKGGTSGQPSN